MERSEFIVTPGFGETLRNDLHFSTAVRIGNRVETSGQGGWNDDLEITAAIEDEIAAAFDIITVVLAQAGASWPQVVHVNTYHVGGFPTVVNKPSSVCTDTICRVMRQFGPSSASRRWGTPRCASK